MPVWAEIVALALAAYGIGLTIGWLAWGRETRPDDGPMPGHQNEDRGTDA